MLSGVSATKGKSNYGNPGEGEEVGGRSEERAELFLDQGRCGCGKGGGIPAIQRARAEAAVSPQFLHNFLLPGPKIKAHPLPSLLPTLPGAAILQPHS